MQHSHTHLPTHHLWLFSHYTLEFNSCDRDHAAYRADNMYHLTLYKKSLPTPGLYILDTSEMGMDPKIWLKIIRKVKLLSRVWLFGSPWTVAYQAPLSMDFSRQEYWSGLPLLLEGIFPTQGSNPGLLHCRQMLYHLNQQGSPSKWSEWL